ncbi:MAG: hypothetical protein LC777_10485 [Actinobacteria bacterium]|nr:hypothetical protein [Actinomycetota bacterium]
MEHRLDESRRELTSEPASQRRGHRRGDASRIHSPVFVRCWRGDPARSRKDGRAGLGLGIARSLVEAQGGRIWAESPASGGGRVSFTLPRGFGRFDHSERLAD